MVPTCVIEIPAVSGHAQLSHAQFNSPLSTEQVTVCQLDINGTFIVNATNTEYKYILDAMHLRQKLMTKHGARK